MARRVLRSGVCLALLCTTAAGQEILDFPGVVRNWSAPPHWSASEEGGERSAASPAEALASVPTSPMPFIGVTPCRIVDTRNASFPVGYGPPSMAANISRNFTLAGRCGIPDSAQAVSLNVTVVSPQGLGYILIYPQGGNAPGVSTLNYLAGQTVANAAIVPPGTGGGVTVVAVVSGTLLLIDTNGYYGPNSDGLSQNTFLGLGAGLTNLGQGNTGIGDSALAHNSAGDNNTAIGSGALRDNTEGTENTVVGNSALGINQAGAFNTAIGFNALFENVTGSHNTAIGWQALANCVGAVNIAVGSDAGIDLVGGSANIYIGNRGAATETGMIRIGDPGLANATFLAGVRGVQTGVADAIPVMVDLNGQLGTISSSVRFKEEIEDMAERSSGLLQLRPVTFRYKGQASAALRFGLIAEEVARVLPDLVVHSPSGEAETVLYHELPAMLVNELQKQQRRIERQEELIAALQTRLTALEAAQPGSRERR
jgi:hypothetical protein